MPVCLRRLSLGAAAVILPLALEAQEERRLDPADRIRLAEVHRLADRLGSRLWPGLEQTPLALLLVTDSTEFLIGHPRPTPDFVAIGRDSLLGQEVRVRPRVFAPSLLATFPAVGGVPTITVGTARNTGKSSSDWVLTLLHEHFHQWQYSLPDYYQRVGLLDLSGGDSTGMWMLNYPFPYASPPVQKSARKLASELSNALGTETPSESSLAAVAGAGQRLARQLTAAQRRYLEFQLWQEGVARWIELKAARLAADLSQPSAEFRALPDYEPYRAVGKRRLRSLQRELRDLDLGRDQRVGFYPMGAGIALLLDRMRPGWEKRYAAVPFALTPLLAPGN